MTKKKRIYKARLLYYFICKGCGRENSQSFKVRNQRVELCRKCRNRRNKIPENQMSLLPTGGDQT